MKDIASEFINKRILETHTESTVEKFTSWPSFLYEKLLSHNDLLKEFSENCKPTQNQTDFARSVSLYNIFKRLKKSKKFLKDIPREFLSTINKNIGKFPQIEKTSYNLPDNIRFEPILNLNLLKLTFESLEETLFILNKKRDEGQNIIDIKKIVESEIKLIKNRIIEIETDINKIPEILTKERKHLKKFAPNKKPKISVITTSYNLAPFVEETVRSVANQNCDNFEHIVIDGASSDNSLKLLKKYPNIILISEKDNGYTDAIWKGLKLAKGKYILQCEISGGYASYDWLSKCIDILDKNSDVSLVWGFPQYLTENSRPGSISYPQFHYNEAPQKQEMFNYWLKSGFFYPEGNLCVRRSVMLKCYPAVEECKKGILDWLEFSYRFNSSGYVSMHLPTLANFGRIHGNQLGKRLEKEGEMKIGRNNYLKKTTYYKLKLLTGLVKHDFIDSEGNKVDLKFDKKKFIMKDIIRNFFTIDEQYLKPKTYFDFIKRKIVKKYSMTPKNIKALAPSFIKEIIKRVLSCARFIIDFKKIKKSSKNDGRFELSWKNIYPCLNDKTEQTLFDRHYVYHTAWAARKVKEITSKKHIDISSSLYFSGIVSAFSPVDTYDYRPAKIELSGLNSKRADLLKLPFKTGSVKSLSCMHVVEHVGLGRYGDPLDPDGDLKAIVELKRVVAPDGSLLFVVPIGFKSKIMYNAHRIYTYSQIMSYFDDFILKEFVLIPEKSEDGGLVKNPSQKLLKTQNYACGCFWFIKPKKLKG